MQMAAWMALWAGAVQQNAAPIQVQIVQEKGLAVATWIGPVISGLFSFFVAWMVFHVQGKKEREQWIRDQKKAEWRELISKVAAIEDHIPVLVESNSLNIDALKNAILSVIPLLRDRIFIRDELERNKYRDQWVSLLEYVISDLKNEKNSFDACKREIKTNGKQSDPLPYDSAAHVEKLASFREAQCEVRNRWGKLLDELVRLSKESLGNDKK